MSESIDSGGVVIRLRLRNRRKSPLTVALEPWGDTYDMPPGEAFDVLATGPNDQGILEIDDEDECIIVYGWSGSIVRLFNAHGELGAGASPRQPAP